MTTYNTACAPCDQVDHVWWLIKGIAKWSLIAFLWGNFVILPAIISTMFEGRNACLEDGPTLCAYKAEWFKKQRQPWFIWNYDTPWAKPGWKLPSDWLAEITE